MSPELYWSDFLTLAGESVYWVTGYVGLALARGHTPQGGVARSRLLSHVGSRLLERQSDDGGWGYCPGVPTDADSTSWCLLFLSALGLPNREAIGRAASFLLKHQSPEDGGFRTYAAPRAIGRFMALDENISFEGWSSSQACVTAASTRALVEAGSPQGVGRAVAYIRRTQTADGYWNAYWWTDNLYSTVLCAEALTEGLEGQGDAARLGRAQSWIGRTQLPDGGWKAQGSQTAGGWPFSTALALRGLMLGPRSNGTDTATALERGVEWLLTHQSADGGWDSHHILRIPHPSTREPWKQAGWREDGRAIGAVIRDHRRLYTTATVFTALSEFERLSRGETG